MLMVNPTMRESTSMGPARYMTVSRAALPTSITISSVMPSLSSIETHYKLLYDQVPSVHQYKQDQFERQRYHNRRKHHHTHGHQHRRYYHVDYQERHIHQKPNNESGLQLTDDKSRDKGHGTHLRGIFRYGRFADLDHEGQGFFVDLAEHEIPDGGFRF